MNTNAKKTKTGARSSRWIAAALTTFLIAGLTGCRTVTVIPADREIVPMPAGQAFTPIHPGFFVPQARMQEILDRLSSEAIYGP